MKTVPMFLPLLLCVALPSKAEKVLVQPGEITQITNSALPEPLLTGTFALKADANGAEGKNTGGACLLFQPVSPRHACRTSEDCVPASTRVRGAGPNVPAGWYGYCPQTAYSSCWFRPGPQNEYCNVGLTLVRDQTMPLPKVGIRPMQFRGKPVRWRVVTCQNLVAGGCGNPNAVEGMDKQLRYGPVRTLRP